MSGQPIAVTDLDIAFGGRAMDLLPPGYKIPEQFDSWSNTWNKLASRWFMSGLPQTTKFDLKDGVDGALMVRHLRAILGSFEPKHEHKIAGVAYLLSQWCSVVEIDGKQVAP